MKTRKLETMTIGGGCFWCIDAIFNEVKGVTKVLTGYTGGTVPGKPTYREVCSGLTGHAEVVQLTFDANIISYTDLLVIFMTSHNPTIRNRQGADVGTQYRSVILYHNAKQKEIAIAVLKQIAPYFEKPPVTEISPLTVFYKAEDVHQNYYGNNQTAAYCTAVITPKLIKLRNIHADKLKKATA